MLKLESAAFHMQKLELGSETGVVVAVFPSAVKNYGWVGIGVGEIHSPAITHTALIPVENSNITLRFLP